MLIEIIQNFEWKGKEFLPGDRVEVDIDTAQVWASRGLVKIVEVDEVEEPEE